jgi:methionine-gamma-lyase
MKEARYHKNRLANHVLHPETLMLGYGYDPALSEGAVKAPILLTSTFVVRYAEEGREVCD